MVIVVPKNIEGLFMIVVVILMIAGFCSPLILTAGIAALMTEEIGLGGSIAMTAVGGVLYLGMMIYTCVSDLKKRKNAARILLFKELITDG